MQRFDRVLTRVENILAASALGLATIIAIVAVVLRYGFGIFLFWSEEAIIYLIIYSTFLGAVITLRHNEHVNVDIFGAFLAGRGKRAFAVLGAAITVVYLVCVGAFAWLLLFEPFSTATITPSLKLPLWVVEAAVPIGFTLMLLRALEILVRTARGTEAFAEGHRSILEVEAEAAGVDRRDVERTRAEPDDPPDRRRGDDEEDGR
ncbi:TRAP transporter small permease [Pseudonocardia kunmingensis]|uniref:C4-dicarboxylate transporter DctQ subunit n=1 Tax=Pseudonocardia kunmingensis TaxID=630975 RepID=A0A543DVU7_9PSEU|nr:TRAP transporter small permease [Pseudonocardia kunmingensis]TQM13445.1 C4-dicarboxylate transporter DctQ subunit [Pseudonocardia kunmingensis]